MIYKKYSELEAWIPTLGAGEYELTVDCSGVPASEYYSEYLSKTSPFGNKFKLNKNGAKFKLWMTNVVPFTNANNMFSGCSGLTSIDTSAFTQVTNAWNMFRGCSGLTSIDTSAFTQVTFAYSMFQGCSGLTSIDTSGLTNVTNARSMFQGCSGLTSITFGTKALTDTDTYLNAPITTARVRGPNAQSVKDTIVNAAATNKWPTSATWTVEQTKEWKFVRVK